LGILSASPAAPWFNRPLGWFALSKTMLASCCRLLQMGWPGGPLGENSFFFGGAGPKPPMWREKPGASKVPSGPLPCLQTVPRSALGRFPTRNGFSGHGAIRLKGEEGGSIKMLVCGLERRPDGESFYRQALRVEQRTHIPAFFAPLLCPGVNSPKRGWPTLNRGERPGGERFLSNRQSPAIFHDGRLCQRPPMPAPVHTPAKGDGRKFFPKDPEFRPPTSGQEA